MVIERQYLAALDLTHQMLSAATNQDWDTLTVLEKQRSHLVAAIAPVSSLPASLGRGLAGRITEIIKEIEREDADILEQVQVWQKHAKILLRLDQPAAV